MLSLGFETGAHVEYKTEKTNFIETSGCFHYYYIKWRNWECGLPAGAWKSRSCIQMGTFGHTTPKLSHSPLGSTDFDFPLRHMLDYILNSCRVLWFIAFLMYVNLMYADLKKYNWLIYFQNIYEISNLIWIFFDTQYQIFFRFKNTIKLCYISKVRNSDNSQSNTTLKLHTKSTQQISLKKKTHRALKKSNQKPQNGHEQRMAARPFAFE